MKQIENLYRLGALTQIVLDVQLARLTEAAAAREVSLAHLASLAQVTQAVGLSEMAQAQVQLTYDRWAEARRAEVNLVLARQTAEWMQARADASLAFGRRDVLRRLAEKPQR